MDHADDGGDDDDDVFVYMGGDQRVPWDVTHVRVHKSVKITRARAFQDRNYLVSIEMRVDTRHVSPVVQTLLSLMCYLSLMMKMSSLSRIIFHIIESKYMDNLFAGIMFLLLLLTHHSHMHKLVCLTNEDAVVSLQFEERQHILYHNTRSKCDALLLSSSHHIDLGFLCWLIAPKSPLILTLIKFGLP